MKLLCNSTDFNNTIKIALELKGSYNKPVLFHCYWNGILSEKHYYSILSCYYFNKNKIILWLENNIPNEFNKKIEEYAEIKYFILENEVKNTFLENYQFRYAKRPVYRETKLSNYVRSILLYKYGGCWFDLDCFFLRSFEPIFSNYENEVCLYQWENQNYPNNGIYISLEPFSEKFKKNMEFIIDRNRGWGFQQANLTYNLPLDILVLPCSWFDGSWIENPYNLSFNEFFKTTEKKYDFDNFFKGSFCYHWHNKWNDKIEENSIIKQLVQCINETK
jgi:hypothetical protein